jgi:hypothetical protein
VGLAVLAGACVSLTCVVSPAEILVLRMRSLTQRRLWESGKWARCWTRECRRWAVPALQTCLRLSLTSVSVWIEKGVALFEIGLRLGTASFAVERRGGGGG